jgi:hypothetical protein
VSFAARQGAPPAIRDVVACDRDTAESAGSTLEISHPGGLLMQSLVFFLSVRSLWAAGPD